MYMEVSEMCCVNRFVAFVYDANNWISSFAFSAMKTDGFSSNIGYLK